MSSFPCLYNITKNTNRRRKSTPIFDFHFWFYSNFKGFFISEKIGFQKPTKDFFDYCFNISALHKNYVKTVADAWYTNGIKTFSDLEEYDELDDSKCQDIASRLNQISNDLNSVYNKLKEGYLVLFSGTPCQVSALNLYLIGKSYDGTLFTIDIVCHGVPSYKLIEMSSRLTGSSISKFRTKDAGWGLEAKRVVYKNGVVSKKHSDDVFYLMFESDRFLRKSCYTCPFSRLPRVGDLSIGDYWGDLSFLKKEDVEKGVSLVLRNTEKGDRLLAIVEHSINKIETRNICVYFTIAEFIDGKNMFKKFYGG
mgnify:CR=1 FL=1